jgi:hypothetical protein
VGQVGRSWFRMQSPFPQQPWRDIGTVTDCICMEKWTIWGGRLKLPLWVSSRVRWFNVFTSLVLSWGHTGWGAGKTIFLNLSGVLGN